MLRKATIRKPDGTIAPLVKVDKRLVEASRPPPRSDLPNRTFGYLLTGAALGALLGWLAFLVLTPAKAKAPLGLRLALGLPLGALTSLTAFLGVLFLFFWTLTDHEVAYHNENLLQTNPISLAMPVIAIGLMRGSRWAPKAFERVSFALAAMAVVGVLLKAMPWWFKQVNGEIIALMTPIWLGLAIAAWLARTQDTRPALARRRGAPGGARARGRSLARNS
jgi:hypothetical protein